MTSMTAGPIRLGVVGCARILPAHLRAIATLQAAGIDPVRITALCARKIDDAVMFRRRGEGPPLARRRRRTSRTRWVRRTGMSATCIRMCCPRSSTTGRRCSMPTSSTPCSSWRRCGCTMKSHWPRSPRANTSSSRSRWPISVRAGKAIATEAARRGLVAGVAENQRYSPRTRALRWVLDQGLVGTPQLWLSGGIGGEWSPDRVVAHTAWRHNKLQGGGGPAIDHGVHLMHQIRYLMGSIDEVSALTKPSNRVRSTGSTVRPDVPVENESRGRLPRTLQLHLRGDRYVVLGLGRPR